MDGLYSLKIDYRDDFMGFFDIIILIFLFWFFMDILINNFPSPVSKLTLLDPNGMECKDFKSPTLLLGFDMGGGY